MSKRDIIADRLAYLGMLTIAVVTINAVFPDRLSEDAMRKEFLRQVDRAITEYKIEDFVQFKEEAIKKWNETVTELGVTNEKGRVKGHRNIARVRSASELKLSNFKMNAKGYRQSHQKTMPANGK